MQTLAQNEVDIMKVELTKKDEKEIDKFCSNPIINKIVKRQIETWDKIRCKHCRKSYSILTAKYAGGNPVCPNCKGM